MVSRVVFVIVMLVVLVLFILWLRALSLRSCSRSQQTRRQCAMPKEVPSGRIGIHWFTSRKVWSASPPEQCFSGVSSQGQYVLGRVSKRKLIATFSCPLPPVNGSEESMKDPFALGGQVG